MTILIFFAVLVILILVHEFGHFIVAKKFGIRVDEFGVGFPPKLFGKKYGETEYTVNALPIGGFVRIWGEDPTEAHYEGPDSERSFVNKPRLVQAAVLVAGVAMNVVLAFALYVGAYMAGMPTAVDPGEATGAELYITYVLPDSPASLTLKSNDQITAVQRGGVPLEVEGELSSEAVAEFIAQSKNEEVTFSINRRGESMDVTVTPVTGIFPEEPERVAAGFTMALVAMKQLPFTQAVVAAGERTYSGLSEIIVGLSTLAVQAVKGEADMANIAGPVGIVGLVGDAAALGFVWLMTFTAFISLNLAVINLLPLPALDGGRLVFVMIESVIRRPIKPIIATRVNQFGFLALLALMALVTVNDILRITG